MAGNATQLETDEQAYLALLGKRVRDARLSQRLSRRALATKSGVSERYLAQLEGGQGNISVLLLRRVAHAIALGLPELLRYGRDQPIELTVLIQYLERLSPHKLAQARGILTSAFGDHGRRKSRDRVALVCLRGAGKSTLGRKFAAALGVSFIEVDREVEREAGAPLADIFSLYGHRSYHRLERRCLERVLEQHKKAVIATGGGIVTEPETYELLRNVCFVVWIKASPEEHMRRVIEQGDMRPMSGRAEVMEELHRILDGRKKSALRHGRRRSGDLRQGRRRKLAGVGRCVPRFASKRTEPDVTYAQGMTIFLVEQNAFAALAIANRGYVLETGTTPHRHRTRTPRQRGSQGGVPGDDLGM